MPEDERGQTLTRAHTHTYRMTDTHKPVSWSVFSNVPYLHRYIFCPSWCSVQDSPTYWGLFCLRRARPWRYESLRVRWELSTLCISYQNTLMESWMWIHHAWNTISSLTDHNVSTPWRERERERYAFLFKVLTTFWALPHLLVEVSLSKQASPSDLRF